MDNESKINQTVRTGLFYRDTLKIGYGLRLAKIRVENRIFGS